jgi:transcriptional regulator with XRE-family HTH domain
MYVSKLERGERDNPTIDTLRAIARALKCSVPDLTGDATRAA